MQITRTLGLLALILMAAAISVGCESVVLKGQGADTQAEPIDPKHWPFVPVAMRIHPFTDIQYDDQLQSDVLEARVELLDRVGDMTKGVGVFRFELYETVGRASANPAGDKNLYTWNVPLTTLEQNTQHYDAITRTYQFKLKLKERPKPDTPHRLVAHFDNAHGRRLDAFTELTLSKTEGK